MKAPLAFALMAFGLMPCVAGAEPENPLQSERWQARPLIVVVPQAGDPLLRRIESALQQPASREAFIEREMVLYRVIEGRATRNGQPLSDGQGRALLHALGADARAPAMLYLVGKDGGIKIRQADGVSLESIFSAIDRMPMRRQQQRLEAGEAP